MAVGSTQPVKAMNTRIFRGGSKGGRCVGLTTLQLSCPNFLEIWEPQPPGILRASPGLSMDCFTFTLLCQLYGRTAVPKTSYVRHYIWYY